jgi:hypothetical protein
MEIGQLKGFRSRELEKAETSFADVVAERVKSDLEMCGSDPNVVARVGIEPPWMLGCGVGSPDAPQQRLPFSEGCSLSHWRSKARPARAPKDAQSWRSLRQRFTVTRRNRKPAVVLFEDPPIWG